MLDKQQHGYYLKRILRDLVSEPDLGANLALKGGTCLYLFHDLPRFSVDLDFNLIKVQELSVEKVASILKKYLDIEGGRFRQSKNGWLWEASYKKGERQFQVDINKRKYPDTYEIQQFYGLSLLTMTPDCMFAHKLCTITSRSRFQNRDVYDSWFMFDKLFEINEEIISIRTGKSLREYLIELTEYIPRQVNDKNILSGLGELLGKSQKSWVKGKLVSELLAQIQLKIDSLG